MDASLARPTTPWLKSETKNIQEQIWFDWYMEKFEGKMFCQPETNPINES